MHRVYDVGNKVEGDRGQKARRIGGGRGMGGGRRGGRKQDSQGGERPGEIEKNFATLHNIL